MAAAIKGAVKGGGYASTSEVVRAAVRDWKMKHALQLQDLAVLKAEIDRGLADVAEGRVQDFDPDRIILLCHKTHPACGPLAAWTARQGSCDSARYRDPDRCDRGRDMTFRSDRGIHGVDNRWEGDALG